MFAGSARKFAGIVIGIIFIGWLMLIIGFGLVLKDSHQTGNAILTTLAANVYTYYPYGMAIGSGFFYCLFAAIQAGIDIANVSNFFGVITVPFGLFFITSLGMIIYLNVGAIKYIILVYASTGTVVNPSFILSLVGTAISALFWVILTMLQICYKEKNS